MEIKTFDECLQIAKEKGDNKHLMLGNGFSVALFPDIFNYVRLAEKITDDEIKALFKEFETSDFEFVMLKLIETLRVLDYYAPNSDLYKKISRDVDALKEILIDVIANSHPENPKSITYNQYVSCYEFLKHFQGGKTYTFNYDLILYWVLMHFKDEDDGKQLKDINDGFRTSKENEGTVTWEIGRENKQSIYYIHGAMHLFRDKFSIIEKLNWKNTSVPISEQVRVAISDNKLPLFISEGTTEHKLKRISENGYLARAMSSIKNISGSLFIFGHSIRDEDDHVFDLIVNEGRIKRVFISCYGDLQSEPNKHIIKKIKNWNTSNTRKEFYIYDAESAKVWNRF